MSWWAVAASGNPQWCDWWISQYSDLFSSKLTRLACQHGLTDHINLYIKQLDGLLCCNNVICAAVLVHMSIYNQTEGAQMCVWSLLLLSVCVCVCVRMCFHAVTPKTNTAHGLKEESSLPFYCMRCHHGNTTGSSAPVERIWPQSQNGSITHPQLSLSCARTHLHLRSDLCSTHSYVYLKAGLLTHNPGKQQECAPCPQWDMHVTG